MSTTIRVTEETKARLERLKGDTESFDDLLSRLADVEAHMAQSAGAWADTERAEHVRAERERLKESFGR